MATDTFEHKATIKAFRNKSLYQALSSALAYLDSEFSYDDLCDDSQVWDVCTTYAEDQGKWVVHVSVSDKEPGEAEKKLAQIKELIG